MSNAKKFASKQLTPRAQGEAVHVSVDKNNYVRFGGKIAMEFGWEVKSPIRAIVRWIKLAFGYETN